MDKITNTTNQILIIFFLVFFLFLFIPGSILSADTIIDTLYSIPYLDGGIAYSPGLGMYGVSTIFGNEVVGDYYSAFLWDYFFNRSFFAFQLPSIQENYVLNSATFFINQDASYGDGVSGVYPQFNMQSGIIEPPCLIEHLDYGYSLDETDFFLSPLNFIGIISDTPEVGWRTIDVTEFVLDDIENARPFTQYRLRLALDMDNDPYEDSLDFRTGDSSYDKPYIVYEIVQQNGVDNLLNFNVIDYNLQISPNPFNSTTTISFSVFENCNVDIIVYNIKGQKVKMFINNALDKGNHSVIWNGDNELNEPVSSGIYFYKLNVNGKTEATKKMLLLK
ncbi:MAG: T9SS type A sorting domain-containing protein [Candidatus Cloacimonadota bacterium]|nr:T9SS type A sorting domain-containing protein [Candidatus Cloacimonadota bacterium]